MRGIDFVVDEAGNRKAVVIDLTVHGKIWREFYSQVQATAREKAPAPEESTQAGAGSRRLC